MNKETQLLKKTMKQRLRLMKRLNRKYGSKNFTPFNKNYIKRLKVKIKELK